MNSTSPVKGLPQIVLTKDMFDENDNLTIKVKESEFPFITTRKATSVCITNGTPTRVAGDTAESFLKAYTEVSMPQAEYVGISTVEDGILTLQLRKMHGELAGAVSNMANGMYPQQYGTLNLAPRCLQYYQSGRLEFICFDIRHTLDGTPFNKATVL